MRCDDPWAQPATAGRVARAAAAEEPQEEAGSGYGGASGSSGGGEGGGEGGGGGLGADVVAEPPPWQPLPQHAALPQPQQPPPEPTQPLPFEGGLTWPPPSSLAPGAWAAPPLLSAPAPEAQPHQPQLLQPMQPTPTPFAAWSNPFASATGAAAAALSRPFPHPPEYSLLGTPQRAPLPPSAPTPHAATPATPATVAAAADLRGAGSLNPPPPPPPPHPHPHSHPHSHPPAAPPPPLPSAIVDSAGALTLGPGPWGRVVSVDAWLTAKLRPHQREGVAFLFRAVMGQAGATYSDRVIVG